MRKVGWISVQLALLVTGGLLATVGDNTWLGLWLILLSVVAWAFSPFETIGHPPASLQHNHSPAEVKQYRVDHPGATISDALRELDRQR